MSRGRIVRRFPVLAIRDFRLLMIDRLLAPASYGFSMVGVSFAVLKATGSPAALSYVLAAQIAPSLLFTLLGGVAADRFPPQRVIVAANLMMAAGEGTFGVLVLTGHPPVLVMVCLEVLTGTGMALFWPASQALLPQLVPDSMLQEASAISRLGMNTGQMAGMAAGGLLVAAAGPGWALTLCGLGLTSTVPVLLAIRGIAPASERSERRGGRRPEGASIPAVAPAPPERSEEFGAEGSTGLLHELRAGWSEFRSHTWLWAIVLQFCAVMMAWYGAFSVLGPVVAKQHLGGPAAWGAITAADSFGLIAGGLVSLRVTPRRPMLFVVLTGGAIAISPLSLAMVLPLPLVCVTSFCLGVFIEMMMVQWTVAMTRNIPPAMLARVSSYDALGSVAAMPVGALIAGPLAAAIGVSAAQYGAAVMIVVASALALIPRDVRTMRYTATAGQAAGVAEPEPTAVPAVAEPDLGAVSAPVMWQAEPARARTWTELPSL